VSALMLARRWGWAALAIVAAAAVVEVHSAEYVNPVVAAGDTPDPGVDMCCACREVVEADVRMWVWGSAQVPCSGRASGLWRRRVEMGRMHFRFECLSIL
jgi:hypothetical protein